MMRLRAFVWKVEAKVKLESGIPLGHQDEWKARN